MKKLLITIFSCLMLVSCCLLGGCASSQEVYKLSKIKAYNSETKTDVTIELGDEYYGMPLQSDTVTLIITDDTAFVRFCEREESGEEDIEVYALQWKQGYNNEYYAYLEGDDDVFIAKKDGNQIVFDFEGEIFIFEK